MSTREERWEDIIKGLERGDWNRGSMHRGHSHCLVGWVQTVNMDTSYDEYREMIGILGNTVVGSVPKLAVAIAAVERQPMEATIAFYNDTIAKSCEEVKAIVQQAMSNDLKVEKVYVDS